MANNICFEQLISETHLRLFRSQHREAHGDFDRDAVKVLDWTATGKGVDNGGDLALRLPARIRCCAHQRRAEPETPTGGIHV